MCLKFRLAAAGFTAALFMSVFPAGASGEVNREAFKDVKFSPEIMQKAMSEKVFLRGENLLQNGAMKPAYGFYMNALMVSLNPDIKAPDGKPVAERLLAQARETLTGGREPNAGCGLNGWSHSMIAQAFLLVKKTPEVWAKLSAVEKDRMDWIMKAMAVAGHWGYDAGNDYKTSLHADDNSYKGWNPNHRLYIFVVLAAAEYFGPKELNDIFVSFDFDEYIKKFDEYGFANIKAVWTCYNWKPIFENGGTYISPKSGKENGTGTGVRHPFTYQKIPLANIAEIYCAAAEYNYSKTVINGIEEKSWILNGGSSPFLGQPGMMLEFDSKDAGGIRSDIGYCNENFCAYTATLMTLKVLGLWPDSERCRNLEKLMYVGNEDFLYKNAMGFHSYAKGHGKDSEKLEDIKFLAYPYVLELWTAYLKNGIQPK